MIPVYMRHHEQGLKNFSLHFDKFTGWDGDKPKMSSHSQNATAMVKHARESLVSIHQRQSNCLKTVRQREGMYWEITAKLAAPYISGLGGNHPTEAGMILDRNTGVPYIPASAIKGVLRLAHVLDIAEEHPEYVQLIENEYEIPDDTPSLRKYFGDTHTDMENSVRGQLVFLDAFPVSVPSIKQDIMNPHFGRYYSGNAPPTETENPIPVMFMSVVEGISFRFRVFAQPLTEDAPVNSVFDENDRQAVERMFQRACTELGFGAKTAIGYGRFEVPVDTTSTLLQRWNAEIEELQKRAKAEADAQLRAVTQEEQRLQHQDKVAEFQIRIETTENDIEKRMLTLALTSDKDARKWKEKSIALFREVFNKPANDGLRREFAEILWPRWKNYPKNESGMNTERIALKKFMTENGLATP